MINDIKYISTLLGEATYRVDNLTDGETIDLFAELIREMKPQELQQELTDLIKKHNVKTINIPQPK